MIRVQVVLKPAESKKLISKAVVEIDSVQKALKEGIVVIHPSSTTYFMFEYITKKKPEGIWLVGMLAPRGAYVEGLTQRAFEENKYQGPNSDRMGISPYFGKWFVWSNSSGRESSKFK